MKVNQIYEMVNDAVKSAIGEQTLLAQDLSNLVDIGKTIANADAYDSFYKAVVNRIGKMYFVDRPYQGMLPKLFKDSWEFGSIVAKVQVDDMEVTENDTWEIINGASYDPFVVNLPIVSTKFYNKMATFELDVTTPLVQIQQSFISIDEMNRFLSMIKTMVYNSMESAIETTTLMALDNLIGATIQDGGETTIHLLTAYNTITGSTLTKAKALLDGAFLRWASKILGIYKKRLASRTVHFNLGGKRRFTPSDRLHFVALSDFAEAMKSELYSTTYHEEFVKLPLYEEVTYWQGSGTAYSFDDVSTINQTVVTEDGTTDSVNQSGIVAVMFDDDAVGILQPRRRVTTIYNPKNETYNDFHKWESRYFNDFNENCVVFVLD